VAVSGRGEAAEVSPATITADGPGWTDRIKGIDFYRCMMNLRERMEADGYLLCVEGARPDVTPSGGLRQMTDGRMAYRLRPDALASDDDMVDISPLRTVVLSCRSRSNWKRSSRTFVAIRTRQPPGCGILDEGDAVTRFSTALRGAAMTGSWDASGVRIHLVSWRPHSQMAFEGSAAGTDIWLRSTYRLDLPVPVRIGAAGSAWVAIDNEVGRLARGGSWTCFLLLLDGQRRAQDAVVLVQGAKT
jgi:hypothetical protein